MLVSCSSVSVNSRIQEIEDRLQPYLIEIQEKCNEINLEIIKESMVMIDQYGAFYTFDFGFEKLLEINMSAHSNPMYVVYHRGKYNDGLEYVKLSEAITKLKSLHLI